jgi:hypothetical protein
VKLSLGWALFPAKLPFDLYHVIQTTVFYHKDLSGQTDSHISDNVVYVAYTLHNKSPVGHLNAYLYVVNSWVAFLALAQTFDHLHPR